MPNITLYQDGPYMPGCTTPEPSLYQLIKYYYLTQMLPDQAESCINRYVEAFSKGVQHPT